MVTQNVLIVPEELIIHKIYLIRDQKVMLDSDLAELYQVDTKRLNEQVKRNSKRFPEDFMFQITSNEFANLKSQIATSSWGGKRKLPLVFTEQGVAMLSGILNSDRAISVNIAIVRIFTKIRQAFTDNTELRLVIEEIRRKTENNTKNIEIVFQYLDELLDKKDIINNREKISYKIKKPETQRISKSSILN